MMWDSIANLKENLNKIALDVHDDNDEELAIYNSHDRDDSSIPDRRISHILPHSKSPSHSPIANGLDSPYNSEIEYYKAEIRKLQESEAEIKALSVNYAALLKEKEVQISRLNEENGSLKQNLNSTNAALNAARKESFRTSANALNVLKGSTDQSPNRQSRAFMKNRSIGSNGVASGQDGLSNGVLHPNIQGNEKEFADLLEEKNRSLTAMQPTHELQMKQLSMELDKERDKLANVQVRLQEEQKLSESLQEELKSFKVDKNTTSLDMKRIQDELNKKVSETRRLQMELHRRDNEDADGAMENLKRMIATLEKENSKLKVEKDELQAALRAASNSVGDKITLGASETANKVLDGLAEVQSGGSFPGKEEMESSLQKLQKDLKQTQQERDKALQQLNRLKQHLLDKESEESEKMDEDGKIIEELRENNDCQRVQILQLEKALTQVLASQEEIKMLKSDELQESKEIIEDLKRKLASCMSTIDAKNVEVLNLQTALGQYYAEIEAKERLGEDLILAREESARLSELLKDAYHQAEISKREKEEILAKVSQDERMIAEGKNRVNKLEEDNEKLCRALEQSMTRLNRMSVDSDYLVDRRIVIKLLVTYFQRNHSKEVLDLMVRMLGFSDEDKQRIGLAQQGSGKVVVRGVLGLPGRLVGGILGGNSTNVSVHMASENQSFADLWVDFLLKETEEREKRESEEATSGSKEDQRQGSQNATSTANATPDFRENPSATASSSYTASKPFLNQSHSALYTHGSFLNSGHSNSEFSTISLASHDKASQISRVIP